MCSSVPSACSNVFREGSEEKRAADRQYGDILNEVREAAEVHRQVRADFMRWVKPGLSMIEIAQYIEAGTRAGLKAVPGDLKRGWAFPTGLSVNHVAAHYSPNYKDTTVLKEGDVMKVDYGTQINGRIIDWQVHMLTSEAKRSTTRGDAHTKSGTHA